MNETSLDLTSLRTLAEKAPGNAGTFTPTGLASIDEFRAALDPMTVLALLDAAELGLAWERAEKALPEGWVIWSVGDSLEHPDGKYEAVADRGKNARHEDSRQAIAHGPTPAAALLALAEKLENR